MDRNQQARDEFAKKQQVARMQREFAAAVSSGKAAVVDRFGHRVEPGMHILLHPPYDYVYTVVDAAPVLDPKIPPGYVRLTVRTELNMVLPVNDPQMMMIVVGSVVGEAGEGAGTQGAATPPPDPIDPPPIDPPPTDDAQEPPRDEPPPNAE
jgi:hypothetical protein